jgi:hypothetical protein
VDGMNSILVTDGGSLFPRICWEVSGVEGMGGVCWVVVIVVVDIGQ